MIDAGFKSLTGKIKSADHLKHNVAFATIDLSNGRELFQRVLDSISFLNVELTSLL